VLAVSFSRSNEPASAGGKLLRQILLPSTGLGGSFNTIRHFFLAANSLRMSSVLWSVEEVLQFQTLDARLRLNTAISGLFSPQKVKNRTDSDAANQGVMYGITFIVGRQSTKT
jgi:hypothetical protein